MRDTVVDKFRMPQGVKVVVGTHTLHRDPQLWEQPDRFDPDRFPPERSAGRNRWQYLPFGGGLRNCIGDHFATLEATLGLASIIRAAQITSLRDDFPLAVSFTTTAAEPIPARIDRRQPVSAQIPGAMTSQAGGTAAHLEDALCGPDVGSVR